MDNKPINASKSQMLKWQKKYNVAKWRFDKLSSEDAESYRDAENARVKKTMAIQCQLIIEASQENPNTTSMFQILQGASRMKKADKGNINPSFAGWNYLTRITLNILHKYMQILHFLLHATYIYIYVHIDLCLLHKRHIYMQ